MKTITIQFETPCKTNHYNIYSMHLVINGEIVKYGSILKDGGVTELMAAHEFLKHYIKLYEEKA